MKPVVLFWAQHLLGSGHLRRTAAIARALAARGVDAVVASGGFPLSNLDLGDARLVQLPALRAADEGFSGLIDQAGEAASEALMAERQGQLTGLLDNLQPSALVTETFPFGRRQLRHEVLGLLDHAGGLERPPVTVCSVRDILQRPSKPERFDTMLALALERYDHILVHGDPRLAAFGETFPHAAALGQRLIHTGYIAADWEPPEDRDGAGADEIIVSAGSGATGAALLAAARQARALSDQAANRTWRLLSGEPRAANPGGGAGEESEQGIIIESNRADFRDLLARCAVSVSQGGYNTITDLIAARARAVVVPYVGQGETEQTERSRRLAGMGSVMVLHEADLAPQSLAQAVDAAFDLSPLSADLIDLGGAGYSAERLCTWIGHV
jgi:predicted glycosyltransferase